MSLRTTSIRKPWILASLGVMVILICVTIRNPLVSVDGYSRENGESLYTIRPDPAYVQDVHTVDSGGREVPHNRWMNVDKPEGLRTAQNCSDVGLQLRGKLKINSTLPVDLAAIQNTKFPDVEAGGRWRPPCGNPERVAVIIPFMDKYGDRTFNLGHLISHLHTVLQAHNKEYIVLVVKQNNTAFFINKGVLMNLGFEYVEKLGFGCIVFNDVDFVPTHDKTEYHCTGQPLHMATYVNDKVVSYEKATGGVLSIPASVFRQLNGLSVRFWGWGNEDDDLANRIDHEKYTLTKADPSTVDFVHMKHRRSYKGTNYRPTLLEYHETGLTTLHKEVELKLLSSEKLPLHTLLTYHITPPDESR